MEKCAATAMNSKLIAGQKDFFSKMVVDAVMMLDELLPLKMIGMKKVQGGALEVRIHFRFFFSSFFLLFWDFDFKKNPELFEHCLIILCDALL